MKEQPILGYDWEMGHEEIKLEIGTYYTGKGLYIGMLAKEDGVWESFSDLTVNEEKSQVPKKKKRNQMER